MTLTTAASIVLTGAIVAVAARIIATMKARNQGADKLVSLDPREPFVSPGGWLRLGVLALIVAAGVIGRLILLGRP